MSRLVATVSTLALSLCAAIPASAQETAPKSSVLIEVFGGGATFGRFLEQSVTATRERELTATTAAAVGGAISVRPWTSTAVRLGFTYVPTELDFEEDSGFDDVGDAGEGDEGFRDLNLYVGTLEATSFLFGERRRFAPYTILGVAGGWWSLDEEEEGIGTRIIRSEEDSQFRVGTVTGLGLQIRATRSLLLRAEVSRISLGNPFDGEEAFRVTTGDTFDEPDSVRALRFTLGLAYAFGL